MPMFSIRLTAENSSCPRMRNYPAFAGMESDTAELEAPHFDLDRRIPLRAGPARYAKANGLIERQNENRHRFSKESFECSALRF